MQNNSLDEQERNWIIQFLGNLLRIGVLTAAVVVLVGGGLYLAQYAGLHPDYSVFHGEPSQFTTLAGIIRNAFGGHSRGIIQLGLLLLILTPTVRVFFSVITSGREKDWMYVGINLVVLAALLYGLLGQGA